MLGMAPSERKARYLPPALPGLSCACKSARFEPLTSDLAASHRTLGLPNSCYDFSSNVQMAEGCIEISFPPSPALIYHYLQSLLLPLSTSSSFPSRGPLPSSFPSVAAAAKYEVPPTNGETAAAPALQCGNKSKRGHCWKNNCGCKRDPIIEFPFS